MTITLRAGATADGVNFSTYFKTFLAKSGDDDHGGNPIFYGGSTQYDGDQLALSYTKDRLILAEGDDLNYTFSTHVLAGQLDTLKFGAYGDDYSVDDDGFLVGTVTTVEVSGLDLYSAAGVKGDVHDLIAGFMGSDTTFFRDLIAEEAQVVYGSKGDDVYVGTAFGDKAFGYAGDDTLAGGAGKDKLDGAAGDDSLRGDAGRDTLTGGSGDDTFVFAAVGDSGTKGTTRDTILDFSIADDLISLKAIDADETKGGNQAFAFAGKGGFTDTAGELVYKVSGGHTIVSGDVDGNGKADFSIDLVGKLALDADDFLL
jgi:serralysin